MTTETTTNASRDMILRWLEEAKACVLPVEKVAQFMSQTLRIGGIKACRRLVRNAIHCYCNDLADGRCDFCTGTREVAE